MSRQEELKSFSDLEINKIIAKKLDRDFYVTSLNSDKDYLMCPTSDEEIDYCGNHNDIMPVAFKHKIELTFENKWRARVLVRGCLIYAANENPLRAICECYILMEEAKS